MDFAENGLEHTLIRLGDLMSGCRDPWCIFGGAAMLLHGYWQGPIADIDVLVSLVDGERLARAEGLTNMADGGTSRFRSNILLKPDLGAVPVEILAGFEIFADGRWHGIQVLEPIETRLSSAAIFIAGIDDIVRIFTLSGRSKDLARLKLLEETARD